VSERVANSLRELSNRRKRRCTGQPIFHSEKVKKKKKKKKKKFAIFKKWCFGDFPSVVGSTKFRGIFGLKVRKIGAVVAYIRGGSDEFFRKNCVSF
jgi:hypothetical protein